MHWRLPDEVIVTRRERVYVQVFCADFSRQNVGIFISDITRKINNQSPLNICLYI